MEESTLTDLEQAKRQLARARKALDSVLKANRREGVWNEHVMRSEAMAGDLVARHAAKVARLTHHHYGCDGMVAQGNDMEFRSDSSLRGNSFGNRCSNREDGRT